MIESFEAGWIKRARLGDRQAQETLVRHYQDRIYRLLYRLSGNREVALDLSQETFLKAFGALERVQGETLGPWLYKIANNLFIDHVRKSRTVSWEPEDFPQEDRAYGRIVEKADLAEALAKLPVAWRQTVVLRHVEDLTYEEIGDILGVPLGTVKTWLYRGRDRLKQLMEGGER